nr:DUF1294 domain-containing protein [Sporobacter termitidis]
MLKLLIGYLLIINLTGFISMGRDKRRAISHGPRTPEKRLFAYALLGGSLGSLLGMSVYRHKIRHLKFTVGMPLILLLQLAVAVAAAVYFK